MTGGYSDLLLELIGVFCGRVCWGERSFCIITVWGGQFRGIFYIRICKGYNMQKKNNRLLNSLHGVYCTSIVLKQFGTLVSYEVKTNQTELTETVKLVILRVENSA